MGKSEKYGRLKFGLKGRKRRGRKEEENFLLKKIKEEEKDFLRERSSERGRKNVLERGGEKPSLGVHYLRKKR